VAAQCIPHTFETSTLRSLKLPWITLKYSLPSSQQTHYISITSIQFLRHNKHTTSPSQIFTSYVTINTLHLHHKYHFLRHNKHTTSPSQIFTSYVTINTLHLHYKYSLPASQQTHYISITNIHFLRHNKHTTSPSQIQWCLAIRQFRNSTVELRQPAHARA
jgi:hypothetical protein